MSSLSRILRNRYKNNYLDLAGINAQVVRAIRPTIPSMEKADTLKEGWARSYPELNLEIDHNPCGYRLELRRARVGIYDYRLRVTFKKDCPFFWSSPAKRSELTKLLNEYFKELRYQFGFSHKTSIATLNSRHTTFVLEGEIKLPE